MNFVKVEKNTQSAPTASQLETAMTAVGGTNVTVEGTNASRKVNYSGTVNHNTFQNKLEEIVPGKKTSWNFIWADALTTALSIAENHELSDFSKSAMLLNSLLAATQKKVTIQISSADLTQLKNSKYRLCFAKKVGDDAYNVVWQSYTNYLSNNNFSWTPQYQLFGSNSFQANVQVDVSTNLVNIGLGETSILDASGLLGPASTGGPSTAITMLNQYGPIHPGVNQISTGIDGKTVTTPIYVAENQIVTGTTNLTPVEKVLVWFEQNIVTSTMFSDSRSNYVEIDLTSVDSATRLYQNGIWTTP
ncbi:MAG: hypothetical protein PHW13_10610 [Methylococcales bacterium]|nr:hypothetical protein [Methylococcales bacterium]